MKSSRILALPLLALVVALGAAGCSEEPSQGTLSVSLTDAPYPFDLITAATLGIEGVEVHVSADNEAESGFWTVSDSSDVLNLLELSNGVTAYIGMATLPTGRVDQMRLLVSSASVTLADAANTTFDLNVPSGDSSGLKVRFDPPIEIVAGEDTNVLVDVDVTRSFSSIPNSALDVGEITGFRFHPVLRVAVTNETGNLAGHVSSHATGMPLAGATVSLWEDGAMVTGTATDANGNWMILGVTPGTQIVRAEAVGYVAKQTTASVSATATTTAVNFQLDPAP